MSEDSTNSFRAVKAEDASCDLATINLENMGPPLKRMLRMQIREFVHYLEDAEDGLSNAVSAEIIQVYSSGLFCATDDAQASAAA